MLCTALLRRARSDKWRGSRNPTCKRRGVLVNPCVGCRQNAMIRSGRADRTVSMETRIMSSAALSVSMTRTRPVWALRVRTRSRGWALGWLVLWALWLWRVFIGVYVIW
jgi:hypothetical protein